MVCSHAGTALCRHRAFRRQRSRPSAFVQTAALAISSSSPSSCQNSPKDRDRVQRCGPFVTRAYLTPFCCLRFVTSQSLPARHIPDQPRTLSRPTPGSRTQPASAWRKITCMKVLQHRFPRDFRPCGCAPPIVTTGSTKPDQKNGC